MPELPCSTVVEWQGGHLQSSLRDITGSLVHGFHLVFEPARLTRLAWAVKDCVVCVDGMDTGAKGTARAGERASLIYPFMLVGLLLPDQAANMGRLCIVPSAVFYSHFTTIAAMSPQLAETPSTSAESIEALRLLAGMLTLQKDKPHLSNSEELNDGGLCGNPLAATLSYMVRETPNAAPDMPFRSALIAGLSAVLGGSRDVSNPTKCCGLCSQRPFFLCDNEQLADSRLDPLRSWIKNQRSWKESQRDRTIVLRAGGFGMHITAQGRNTTREHETFTLKHPKEVAKVLLQASTEAAKSTEHTTIDDTLAASSQWDLGECEVIFDEGNDSQADGNMCLTVCVHGYVQLQRTWG